MKIDLTDDEQVLLAGIDFEALNQRDQSDWRRNSDLVLKLTKSLLARKAIPDYRLKVFTDPAYTTSRGGSWKSMFERNGSQGDEIIRHNHFLPILKYFIFGPDLPAGVIAEFMTARAECGEYPTSGDVPVLSALARKLYRRTSLDKRQAADEFFRLGIETGLSPSWAMSLRTAVMQAK